MTYRDDLDALAHRKETLAREVEAKARELAQASVLLEDARARRHLPILDNIRVASPCDVPWSTMTGDERVRHCKSCDKQVFNLSEMTREQAEGLIIEKAGKLCVRYFRRTDGTILLGDDCKVGVRRKRVRIALIAGAAATALGSTAIAAYSMHEPDGPANEMLGVLEVGEVEQGVVQGHYELGRMADVEPVVPDVLDERGIGLGMATVQPLIQECAKKFPAHGSLKVDIHVAPSGAIDSVTVAQSLTYKHDLEACLVSAMHQAKFQRSASGAVFTYPLVF